MCHRERIFQCCQKATGPNTVCDLITWECILLSTATFSFLEEQLSLSLPVWRSAKLLCRCQEPDLPQIQCLVHLGAVPTGPTGSKGFRHFSRTTEQRQWLELLATVINDYCVRAWQPGFTTQVQRRHSGHMVKSPVNPECVRFTAHTEPARLARLARPANQSHCICPALCIWVQ